MKHIFPLTGMFVILLFFTAGVNADTIMNNHYDSAKVFSANSFPDMTHRSDVENAIETAQETETIHHFSIWPFGKKDDDDSTEFKPKSTRKAFFLSFLLPGLGEAYVGSKRGFLFAGIEIAAWWLYLTNTRKGEDMEADFHDFANLNWHFTDIVDSQGDDLDFNYWKWIQFHLREVGYPDDIDPFEHSVVDSLMEETVKKSKSSIFGHSVHNLPSKKTQQYYEMIGKYPQFVYGWEDIESLNPTIRQDEGTIKFDENIRNIKSQLRNEYEDMRYDSNQKLKAGQRGIYIMLFNRVFSAIDAARLAYHHNKKLDSDLSSVRIQFVQKHIIDNEVPMIMVTKKF